MSSPSLVPRVDHYETMNHPITLGDAPVYLYVTYVLTAYGGGVLCPLLLGKSPKPLESDTILVLSFIAFILFTRLGFKAIYNFLPVHLIGLVLENSFKGGLIATFFTAAKSSLGTMLGPLIVGTVAGCGGAVIWGPSGWGKDGCPKPIWSSLMAALFFALSTDPSYTALLPISVSQLTTDDATVMMVLAFTADALKGKFMKPAPSKSKTL